jgi:uridine phosphorylase
MFIRISHPFFKRDTMTIKPQDYPLLEFDYSRQAIIEPKCHFNVNGLHHAVLCFFSDVLNQLKNEGRLTELGNLGSEIGPNPVYQLDMDGQKILVIHPGVGASLAVGFLEETIALGVQCIIACGGCGVLNAAIDVGHPMIVESAVRDEGTSYHYLPPGRETTAHPEAIIALEETFTAHQLPIQRIKTWTTDGLYRETPARRALRVSEGCKVVEMEASAFFAVAHFRNIKMGQILYGGDLVIPEGWDSRGWDHHSSSRELLFWLAVEAVLKLTP